MDTQSALRQRARASTQKDVLLGLFFESSLAHIERRYGADVQANAKLEIFRNKIPVQFFRYPVGDLLRLVDFVVAPHGVANYESHIEDFGAAAVTHFLSSPVGKTMTMLAGGNAHRLLSSAPAGYKAVTSFGERNYHRLSENSAEIAFKQELLGPAWQVGVIREALKGVGGVDAKVAIKDCDSDASNFVITCNW
jgi:uncharacterized protein (TIGR02265 family)